MNRKKVCPIVSLCVHSKGYSTLSLTLHADLMICEPLLCQPVAATVKTNSHLKSLDLADLPQEKLNLPVDILVGCDQYWELVTGSICRGEKGPTAIHVHTKLGWVLSGQTLSSTSALCSNTLVTSTHMLQVNSRPAESSETAFTLNQLYTARHGTTRHSSGPHL